MNRFRFEGPPPGDDEPYEPLPRPDDVYTQWFTDMLAIKEAFEGGLITEEEFELQNQQALQRWRDIPSSHTARVDEYYSYLQKNCDSEVPDSDTPEDQQSE